MTRERRMLPGVLLALVVATCDSVNDPETDECPQTYEFGNYGCARLLVVVHGPPAPWPAAYRLDVRATPARPGTGAESAVSPQPDTGAIRLHITRHLLPEAAPEDTASFWISARLLEIPSPIPVGVPLPVFAADSTLRILRFAGVGRIAPIDTVHLQLHTHRR